MRTTRIIIVICMSALSLALFQSCEKKEIADVTKPVIHLIEPAEGDSLLIGDPNGVHFDVELSDDVMLKSYKVNIHSNFNGHTHTAIATKVATTDFSYNKVWSLTGQKNAKIHHHEIIIPEDATPGEYHLMVYCTDEAGNESYVAREIILSHDGEEHDHDH